MNKPVAVILYVALIYAGSVAAVTPHCSRPAPGSPIPELGEVTLHGQRGWLGPYAFAIWGETDPLYVNLPPDAERQPRYCMTYRDPHGKEIQNPVLRVHPNDKIELNITNTIPANTCTHGGRHGDVCLMNIHWHGLNIRPSIGQDEAIHTVIRPGSKFHYGFRIPANDPRGLYWYHPHIHMASEQHLLGGLSGLVVFDGTERHHHEIRGTQEKLLILRDMLRVHPDDNKAAPWRDVSINDVPVIYPDYRRAGYQPGLLRVASGRKIFWRIANAAADTIFNLQLRDQGRPVKLKIVEIDGIPLAADDGKLTNKVIVKDRWLLGPGQRVGFTTEALYGGKELSLWTLAYDSGGDSHPERPLARIRADVADTPLEALAVKMAVEGEQKAKHLVEQSAGVITQAAKHLNILPYTQ